MTSTVFLLDVDNTLIDNDAVKAHIESVLRAHGGEALVGRFWAVYEAVRADLDTVSIPITLERLRREASDPRSIDDLGRPLFDGPFASFVYPGVPDLLAWLRDRGLPVILSDGDPWYQAKKITDAGLGAAVGGNVLIFVHKEEHIADVLRWYPADRYVAIDDKARLLALLKEGFSKDGFGDRVETVWVRQGHYAESDAADEQAAPDYSVTSIADVRSVLERAHAWSGPP